VLGALDRAPGCPTPGSFSRRSWLYRFPGTFHSAAPQCAIHPLLKLWAADVPGNPFHGSGSLQRLIGTAAEFTTSLQGRDGSFAEWYPGQPGYCATAHLLAHLSETSRAAAAAGWQELADRLLPSLERAAAWLSRQPGTGNGNQTAAAVLGLGNCSELLGTRWVAPARRIRDRLLSEVSPDGWIPEQGGPDPGYLSVSLDFLSRAHDRGAEGLETAIAAGLRFLDRVLMPDGSLPAALSWRGTNFLVPYFAERWMRENPGAGNIARRLREAIRRDTLPTPATVDDHYCGFLFLPSYVDAFLSAAGGHPAATVTGEDLPESPSPEYVVRRCKGLVVTVLAGRGTFAVFCTRRERVLLEDRGYCLESPEGLFLAESSAPSPGEPYGKYRWETAFRRVGGTAPWSRRFTRVLPGVASLHSWLPASCRNRIEKRIREAAFRPGKTAAVRIRREIDIQDGRIRILDRIHGRGTKAFRIHPLRSEAPSNNPCTGFFALHELETYFPVTAPLEREMQKAWKETECLEIERILDPDDDRFQECTVNGRLCLPGMRADGG